MNFYISQAGLPRHPKPKQRDKDKCLVRHGPKCKPLERRLLGLCFFARCLWLTQSKQQVFSLSHQIAYMMLAMPCFPFPPVLLWRYQIESKRDQPLVFQHVSLIEKKEECTAAAGEPGERAARKALDNRMKPACCPSEAPVSAKYSLC